MYTLSTMWACDVFAQHKAPTSVSLCCDLLVVGNESGRLEVLQRVFGVVLGRHMIDSGHGEKFEARSLLLINHWEGYSNRAVHLLLHCRPRCSLHITVVNFLLQPRIVVAKSILSPYLDVRTRSPRLLGWLWRNFAFTSWGWWAVDRSMGKCRTDVKTIHGYQH